MKYRKWLPVSAHTGRRLIDRIGEKSGKLTVIAFAGVDKYRQTTWLAECSCPNRTKKIVTWGQIRKKSIVSCGDCPNKFEIHSDGVIVIQLIDGHKPTRACFIDADDYPLVKNQQWHVLKSPDTYYAFNRQGVGMPRFILPGVPSTLDIDHRNHLGYDNRKTNLRAATEAQNAANAHRSKRSITGFIGVHRSGKSFYAQVQALGVTHYFGSHPTALAAALARDRGAKALHGEFAVLNFPPETPKDYFVNQREYVSGNAVNELQEQLQAE
jgi:hypothetical protein